jgi:hypothetical protein
MQFKENNELKDFNKEELINKLDATNKALKAIYNYFDLLSLNYHDKLDNKHLFELQSFLFGNSALDNFIYQLQDADKTTDDALFYLLNLEKLDNKKGE